MGNIFSRNRRTEERPGECVYPSIVQLEGVKVKSVSKHTIAACMLCAATAST